MSKYLNQLTGKTIKRVVKDSSEPKTVYGLEFTDGSVAWILCDPEGNGPGHLEIEVPNSADSAAVPPPATPPATPDLAKLNRKSLTHTVLRDGGKIYTISSPLCQRIVERLRQQHPACEVLHNGQWDKLDQLQGVPKEPDKSTDYNKLSKTNTVIRIGEKVSTIKQSLNPQVFQWIQSNCPTAEIWFNNGWRTQAAVQGVM